MPRRPTPSSPAHHPPQNLRNLRNLRTLLRFQWHIRGQVQGVGFRPFVYRIATAAGITGRVLNNAAGVLLEIQGTPQALEIFAHAFQTQLPPLARVDSCHKTQIPPRPKEQSFIIDTTQESPPPSSSPASSAPLSSFSLHPSDFSPVTPDTALCQDCLRELFSPTDRRHLHPLINCTNCGPRFSIIKNVPYDRKNTTMAPFKMCPACKKEYQNPADRRFHAQPVCCPNCGPHISLYYSTGNSGRKPEATPRSSTRPRPARGNPLALAAELLLAGKILAIKGLGGFHLAVRADLPQAVDRLRSLKKRDAKPFALMFPNLQAAQQLVHLSPQALQELTSQRAPIILAPRLGSPSNADKQTSRQGEGENPIRQTSATDSPCLPISLSPGLNIAPSVAPGTNLLGILLPYTPLHHLLFHALSASVPQCLSAIPPLVMTSGNLSNEPLVIDNDDALTRLGPLCDAILLHDRPIERCVDDSVFLDRGPSSPPLPIRRSRGYTPTTFLYTPQNSTLKHPHSVLSPQSSSLRSGLCLGGELKNTIAVVRPAGSGGGAEIILSQHLGDLSDARSFDHFQQAIADLIRLFHIDVQFIAHDLHPNYMSTIFARKLAAQYKVPLLPIQHHLAHAHAVMGEHRLHRALAIIADGTGYGTDGTIWGGELLYVNGKDWQRLGSLKPFRLPGGDAAAKDPRRSAMALLYSAFGPDFYKLPAAQSLFPDPKDRQILARMITTGISSPWTTSTGRLFDGVAALLGICRTNNHEAQAAMALEAAAWTAPDSSNASANMFDIISATPEGPGAPWQLDFVPFIRRVVLDAEQGVFGSERGAFGARLFHFALAEGLLALAETASKGAQTDANWAQKHPNIVPLVTSGGVFCNRLLEQNIRAISAQQSAHRTFFHELYPPTDAGLAFGQAIYSQLFY